MEEHNSNLHRGSHPAGYPSLTQSVANGPFEKQGMNLREISHPLSSHLSRRRATSQIASPIVDFDVAVAEKPYKKPQNNHPVDKLHSYYITNPRSPDLAWYLTKEKSDSNSREYEVERVPVHVVQIRQNRIGYLIEAADRDDITLAAGHRPVSWTPKCRNGWSTTPASSTERAAIHADVEPCKRVNRFNRCSSDEDIKTPLHDEPNITVGRRDIPLITKNIIHQLHKVGLPDRLFGTISCIGNGEATCSEDERDLENAIETTLLQFRTSPQCVGMTEAHHGEILPPQGKMAPQFSLENEHPCIRLRPSVVADPAITLSTPQTSFTAADANHKHDGAQKERQREAPTVTTLVSPQSAVPITWTEDGGHLGEPFESSATASSPSNEDPESTSQTCRPSSCRDHSQDQDLEASQSSLGASSIASTITSFPKLLSRHCTREWIRPITNLEDIYHKASDDSHYQPVDAHADLLSHHHMPFSESPFTMPWPGDGFQSRTTSSYLNNEALNARRSTVSQPLKGTKEFGSQIGSAAHRRRSAPADNSKTMTLHDHFLPNILGKFFIIKRKKAPRSPDSQETEYSGALPPYNSPVPDHMPVSTPETETGSSKGHTPTVSVEDRLKIHEALVGGSAVVDTRRRDTCSEDNRPHVCEEDMENRVMND